MKKKLPERIRVWGGEFCRRIQKDGIAPTWKWLYGHGVPSVFGVPIIKYHQITDRLFLGPQHTKLGRRALARAGVTASVSMRTGYSDVEKGVGFTEYLQLPTTDGTAPTLDQLRHGVEFIRRVIDNGGRVYVHCQTGFGRGPTMAAAYLISEGRSLIDAREIIESVRPFTEFTGSQLKRLMEFERNSNRDDK